MRKLLTLAYGSVNPAASSILSTETLDKQHRIFRDSGGLISEAALRRKVRPKTLSGNSARRAARRARRRRRAARDARGALQRLSGSGVDAGRQILTDQMPPKESLRSAFGTSGRPPRSSRLLNRACWATRASLRTNRRRRYSWTRFEPPDAPQSTTVARVASYLNRSRLDTMNDAATYSLRVHC
jgi:hypothetical protein